MGSLVQLDKNEVSEPHKNFTELRIWAIKDLLDLTKNLGTSAGSLFDTNLGKTVISETTSRIRAQIFPCQ